MTATADAPARATRARERLGSALRGFGVEALRSMSDAERDTQRTLDWLAARRRHWQEQVRRRQERLTWSLEAVATSQSSTYYDPQTGSTFAPNPDVYEMALRGARARLRKAEARLQTADEWSFTVQQATADYRHEAQHLTEWVRTDLPLATALLGGDASTLRGEGRVGTRTWLAWPRSTERRFTSAWETVVSRWEEARVAWDGPARRQFEQAYWAPLAGQVGATRRELERLTHTLRQAGRAVR